MQGTIVPILQMKYQSFESLIYFVQEDTVNICKNLEQCLADEKHCVFAKKQKHPQKNTKVKWVAGSKFEPISLTIKLVLFWWHYTALNLYYAAHSVGCPVQSTGVGAAASVKIKSTAFKSFFLFPFFTFLLLLPLLLALWIGTSFFTCQALRSALGSMVAPFKVFLTTLQWVCNFTGELEQTENYIKDKTNGWQLWWYDTLEVVFNSENAEKGLQRIRGRQKVTLWRAFSPPTS